MRLRFATLALAVLLFTLACGGKQDAASAPTPSAPMMNAEEAMDLAAVFLAGETDQNTPDGLPAVEKAGDAFAAAGPNLPDCVNREVLSATSVKFTYTNCTGPRGGTVNGVVVVTWTTDRFHFSKEFRQFVVARNGKSWTLNGTKKVDLDPVAKQSHVTAENFHKVWNDGTTTKDFHYTCNLWADWATQGSYKLYGTWGLQSAGYPAIQVSIDKATPLTWNRGCCHPVAGTKEISRGSEKATLVFGPACGDVTVNGEKKNLAPCPAPPQ